MKRPNTLKLLLSLILVYFASLILPACGDISNSSSAATSVSRVPTNTSARIATPAITKGVTIVPSTTAGLTPATTRVTTATDEGNPLLLTPTPPPSVAGPSDWEYNWLKGVPCRAPCYLGITPGQTSYQQALQTLKSNSDLEVLQDAPCIAGKTISGQIRWVMKNQADKNPRYQAAIGAPCENDNQIVDRVLPNFSKAFRLSDVVATYGEPSDIVVTIILDLPNKAAYFTIEVIFLAQGILFNYQIYSQSLQNKPAITPNLLSTEGIAFYAPNRQGLERLTFLDRSVKWQGFQSFDFYCRTGIIGQKITDCSGITSLEPGK